MGQWGSDLQTLKIKDSWCPTGAPRAPQNGKKGEKMNLTEEEIEEIIEDICDNYCKISDIISVLGEIEGQKYISKYCDVCPLERLR